jgi:hypothetical protein
LILEREIRISWNRGMNSIMHRDRYIAWLLALDFLGREGGRGVEIRKERRG